MEEQIIKFGYARVWSVGQDREIQTKRLVKAGVEENDIFTGENSKENMNRQGIQGLLTKIQTIKNSEQRNAVKSIHLYICSMDRLGRSTLDMLKLIEKLNELEVTVIFLDERLTSRHATPTFVMKILTSIAKSETTRNNERAEGGPVELEIVNNHLGATRSIDRAKLIEMHKDGANVTNICRELDIRSRSSVYRILKEEGVTS